MTQISLLLYGALVGAVLLLLQAIIFGLPRTKRGGFSGVVLALVVGLLSSLAIQGLMWVPELASVEIATFVLGSGGGYIFPCAVLSSKSSA